MASSRPTALVTGASGGIGYELAKLFAADGWDVVLVARSADKLTVFADELHRQYSIIATPLTADLNDPQAPQHIFDQLAQRGIAIDALVNNAGFGSWGNFAEIPLDESLGQIQLNVTALTHLTRLFLPGMVARGASRRGYVLNVASTAAFQPGPLMAVYYATKAYVLHFSEAINYELRKTGVTCTCLCPGPVLTGFQDRAQMGEARLMKTMSLLSAEQVAKIGYKAMQKGKPVAIAGWMNWLVATSGSFAPRSMVTAIAAKMAEK